MHRRIVVIGSSNVDFIMKMERLPRRGETVTDATFAQTFGGKGANLAVGAARAGGDVWFVNCVGNDAFGPLLQNNLYEAGVHTDYIFIEEGVATGAALVMVDRQGENYLSVAPGANYRLTPDRVAAVRPLLEEAALVALQYEVLPETLYAAIDLAHALGRPVLFNLAPARPFDCTYLPRVTYLVVNEVEAQALCGFAVDSPERAAEAAGLLLERGVRAVIITLGAAGAYLAAPDLRMHLPSFPVEAVDTTAAGDIFCGALATALVEGRSLLDAARFASAAAALSVTRMGAQPSAPRRAEIDYLLERA
ncbi:MAG: ribokinase [Chloroherpetonaceae bacterium]|nr:ribokinase [Chthonomonadaceae bacterium]MDW8209301.1 ribokinase [Chloroherpetonaceae bacterium]